MNKLDLAGLIAAKKAALTRPSAPPKESLAQRIERLKQEKLQAALAAIPTPILPQVPCPESIVKVEAEVRTEAESETENKEAFNLSIVLNEKQLLAKEYAFAGKSYCLIGAAGTGKTTAQREVAEALLKSGKLGICSFKPQGQDSRVQAPSIAFCSYTRRATGNLQRAIHKKPELEEALKFNIMTIHALLEYQPVFYQVENEKGEFVTTMRFEPKRTASNPLEITHLVLEETSMLSLDLWEKLLAALRPGVQIIFIGDINQLQPVFGPSILNYGLVQLPVLELTEVYRQAGDSLILENAHRILKGQSLVADPAKGFSIIQGKSATQVSQHKTSLAMASLFRELYTKRGYDPDQDIILTPWNKRELGSIDLNNHIAQFLGETRGAEVHEIQAGFAKLYLAVGDKVMVNRQDGVILSISRNGLYHGVPTQPASKDLSRFGHRLWKTAEGQEESKDLDDILLGYENYSPEELEKEEIDRKLQASHVVTCKLETGEEVTLDAASDFSPQSFGLGYVLTVHKAQGCEWRKVFIILHKDHAGFLHRELLYTAVTRAREECILLAKETIITKAIQSPRIKGNTLEDKIAYFNSGAATPVEAVRLIP